MLISCFTLLFGSLDNTTLFRRYLELANTTSTMLDVCKKCRLTNIIRNIESNSNAKFDNISTQLMMNSINTLPHPWQKSLILRYDLVYSPMT